MSGCERDQFAAFCDAYLTNWEQRSNLRRQSRYSLEIGADPDKIAPRYPPSLFNQPEVVALSEDGQRALAFRLSCAFLNEIALIETDVTGELAAALAHRRHCVPLPAAACQVALTVATDEPYHAFAAREFILQAQQTTGFALPAMEESSFVRDAVAAGRITVPAELRQDFDLVAVSLLENVITHELMGLTREALPESGFMRVMAEHLADEGRHAAFFQRLLAYCWKHLPETERSAIGAALPPFLLGYLRPQPPITAFWAGQLEAVGVAEAAAARIASEAAASFSSMADPRWTNLRAVMDKTGITAHSPTREALARAGLLQ